MADPASVAPASPLGFGSAVLAFDVGGTDTKSALFDTTGAMIGLARTPTPAAGLGSADAVLAHVETVAAGFRREHPEVIPAAVAMIAPGIVDDERGIAVLAANLSWDQVPFRDLLTERLGLPASFTHDARAAGEAEFRLGAARPYRDVVVMVIGTGVSAALFVDGRPHSSSGYAGEIGHAVIDPRGEPCVCGARGCLETVASAGAIVRRYQAATGVHRAGAREVLGLAGQGDPVASRIWDEAVDALALSISQLAAVLAPEAVVIGGGLAQAGDALFLPLRNRVDGLLTFHRRPALLPALLGENAGLLGAALRARGATGFSLSRETSFARDGPFPDLVEGTADELRPAADGCVRRLAVAEGESALRIGHEQVVLDAADNQAVTVRVPDQALLRQLGGNPADDVEAGGDSDQNQREEQR